MSSHTRVAAGNINPSRFVTLAASDGQVSECSAATDKIFGISQPETRRTPYGGLDDGYAAIATEELQIFGPGDNNECLLELGGTVVPGDKLTATTGGKGIKTVTDHNEYGAIALFGGVSGEFVPVEVRTGQISL